MGTKVTKNIWFVLSPYCSDQTIYPCCCSHTAHTIISYIVCFLLAPYFAFRKQHIPCFFKARLQLEVFLIKFADVSFPQDRTSTRSETSTRCGRASRPTSSTRSRATRDWQTSERTPYSNHIKTFSPGCRRWPKMWRSPLSSTTTATSPRWTWSATLLLSPSPKVQVQVQ